MRIAIIGGGFTGLTAAYELVKYGHAVTIFEKESVLGGLAHGFKMPSWNWHLEKAYHHLFTNDHAILGLIKELGIGDRLIVKRPITANYWNDHVYQFDSPMHLLTYPAFSLLDKLRTALLLAFLKLNPFWRPLEKMTAKQFVVALGGNHAWETLWGPLMGAKFGTHEDTIAASWLWARIKKRTPKLCYIEGGFQTLVNALKNAIITRGGVIHTNTAVISILNIKKQISNIDVKYQKGKNRKEFNELFDSVLLTIPTPLTVKLVPQLPPSYYQLPMSIPHLHAQVLILETSKPIVENVYWLNIIDRRFPFLAVVAHTNFMDPSHYAGHHLTYFGNYLPSNHPYLSMTKEELIKLFLPYIKKLNPTFDFKLYTLHFELFTGFFAQPVHERHYSKRAPKLQTPLRGVYLANMDSIYPWDRGTNYAVELGKKAAKTIHDGR